MSAVLSPLSAEQAAAAHAGPDGAFLIAAGPGTGKTFTATERFCWLVDHGVSFSVEPKLRTVIWDFAGERLPPALCSDIERLAGELDSGPLREQMLELIDQREVNATVRRARALVRSGRFPSPGSRRSYPWPPV